MGSFKDKYKNEVTSKLKEKFNYTSNMQVPKLEKIVLNAGVGEAATNSKAMESVVYAMTNISGQKPVIAKAKKSISNFKVREGMSIGCYVTLRGQKMFDFMERLVRVAMPRIRDFRGVSRTSFDGHGNYTMGIKEQIAFPEVNMEKMDQIRGFDVTFVTSAKNDEEAFALLEEMGIPFKKN